jgi:uncharacterized protein YutE (UPF0331/DUF86 family)
MDKNLVLAKMDSLSRCIERVEKKRPHTLRELEQDDDAQDIIAVNLQRAVQLCIDAALTILSELDRPVPPTMSEAFEELKQANVINASLALSLQKAVGFRDISVHAYKKIDWAIVWRIITEHLDVFRRYAAALTDFAYRH